MDLSHYNQLNLFGADMIYPELLEPGDLCYTIKEEITPLVKDTDFEDMYKDGGRPPVSPRILLLVTIMQFLEKLSDRAAATNLKFRLDWKIAFNLPLDYMGIHPTTLCYFRERLVNNEKASLAFDKVLEHLVSVGLVKKRGKQRIDSTHIIANVRELSRLELLTETLRLFCVDIKKHKISLEDDVLLNYFELYIEKFSIKGLSNAVRDELIQQAGNAMQAFVEWTKNSCHSKKITGLKSFEVLEKVLSQNFEQKQEENKKIELIKVATGKDHICSPHEVGAEYANKGGAGWLGYKAQVVETVNGEEEVNFITHIEATAATDHDGNKVLPIVDELERKEVAPAELYGDTHYNTEDNIKELKSDDIESNIELKGPVVQKPAKKTQEKNKGFTHNREDNTVICPIGVISKKCTKRKNDNRISASFPQEKCNACNRRDKCRPEVRGKCIEFWPESKILAERRALMETDDFKEDMHKRNGIEGTISGLVRGQGMRRIRYRGQPKANLQIKFCGVAANISRLHRYREIERSGIKTYEAA